MPKLFEEQTPKTIWEKTNLILHNSQDEDFRITSDVTFFVKNSIDIFLQKMDLL